MLGCTHGAWSALPVLSPFKLVLFLSTFASMQVCAVAKRLFDEAQREPDKKMSRALNKQAQQWLDDYCLHSADMVGAVHKHAAPLSMLCMAICSYIEHAGNPVRIDAPLHTASSHVTA